MREAFTSGRVPESSSYLGKGGHQGCDADVLPGQDAGEVPPGMNWADFAKPLRGPTRGEESAEPIGAVLRVDSTITT
jgi:hypothetical protein